MSEPSIVVKPNGEVVINGVSVGRLRLEIFSVRHPASGQPHNDDPAIEDTIPTI